MKAAAVLLALVVGWTGCGYHVAGQADTIPDEVRTIAVPPFTNNTSEYKVEQYLTAAVVRELLSRTRYEVVADPNAADATLQGAVVNFFAFPANFDPLSNRATGVSTIMQVSVTLWDRKTGQPIYQNPQLGQREQYEVSADANAYFEERQAALNRASESLARTLVSAILEGF